MATKLLLFSEYIATFVHFIRVLSKLFVLLSPKDVTELLKSSRMDCKYDVFISYSRKDYVDAQKNVIPGNVVSKIKKALTDAGITYWFDEEGVYSGDEFAKVIVRNIKSSRIFVFLSSVNSNKSEWTTSEIATANSLKKIIIPVLLDGSTYHDDVILYLSRLSHIEFSVNPEKGCLDLVNAIKAHLAQMEEEKRKKEEEENRKREIERKKAEEARRRHEEEKKRHREEQERLVAEIQQLCQKINSEESKLEIDRNTLLLSVQKVEDKSRQEKLKTFIIESSPIRRKVLTDGAHELMQLKKALEEKEQECEQRLKEIQETADSQLAALNEQLGAITAERDSLQSELGRGRQDEPAAQLSEGSAHGSVIGGLLSKYRILLAIVLAIIVLLFIFMSQYYQKSKWETTVDDEAAEAVVDDYDYNYEEVVDTVAEVEADGVVE